jgi:transcription factor SPN1
MSHGGIFGSDSDSDSDDESPAVTSSSSLAAAKPKITSSTAGGIFGSDSDSDSEDDDDLSGMSSLKPTTGDRSTAVKKAALAAKRKREEEAKKRKREDNSSSDSYDSEDSDSENEDDKSFIDNEGVDKAELNETRFYDGAKRDERPRPRKGRKPKDALEEAMDRLKKPKNKTELSEEQLQEQARSFITRMNRAYTKDVRAKSEGRPALNKIKMLKEVVNVLSKSGMRDRFLQNQVCAVVHSWLEVGKDGILPTLAIRTKLFQIMDRMTPKGKVDPEDMRRYLQSSRIGSIFNFFSQHAEETKDNKILLKKILERWMNEVVHGRTGNDFASSKKEKHRSNSSGGKRHRKKKKKRITLGNGSRAEVDDETPILSGNQYARAVPESLTFDFARVATGPISRDEIVREDQLNPKDKSDDLSKRAILNREFRKGSTALPKSQRPVKISITGKGMAH